MQTFIHTASGQLEPQIKDPFRRPGTKLERINRPFVYANFPVGEIVTVAASEAARRGLRHDEVLFEYKGGTYFGLKCYFKVIEDE